MNTDQQGDDTAFYNSSESIQESKDLAHLTSQLSDLELKPDASPANDEFTSLEQQQVEYKKQALKYKRENDLPKAREMLVISKKIQEQLDRLAAGFAITPGFEIPSLGDQGVASPLNTVQSSGKSQPKPAPIPAQRVVTSSKAKSPAVMESRPSPIKLETPIVSKSPSISSEPIAIVKSPSQIKPTVVESPSKSPTTTLEQPIAQGSQKDIFKHLSDTLQSQITSCTQLSAYFFKSGQKEKALEFHKRKKVYAADLETVNALSSTPGSVPPAFKYVQVAYDIETSYPELAMTELELSIIKAYDLNLLPVADLESSISFQFEGLDDSSESKGETGTIKKDINPGLS